jgi:tetratricopeptide repeat protein 21B
MTGQFTKALDNLNQAVVLHSWFLPALSEKAKTLLLMGDWEQALETAQRVLNENEYEIDALNIFILYMLAREGNSEEAVRKLQQLNEALDRNEPNNPQLYMTICSPFVRICGRNPEVLRCTMNLVRRAMELDSDNSDYAAELGHQLVLYGELDEALEQYRRSAKLDETNVTALHGMIGCQLEEGQLDDAEQQLEFLMVISDGDQDEAHQAQFAYLQSRLAWEKSGDANKQIALLEQAYKLTRSRAMAAKGQRGGGGGQPTMRDSVSPAEFLELLNPELLLKIASDYMIHCGSEPLALEAGEYVYTCLEEARKLLDDLAEKVPGMLEAKLMGAKGKFIANDIDGAQADINKLLQSDPAHSGAHLLSARVLLLKEEYKGAQNALEQAQANDFSIRTSPVFAVVKAKVQENMNDLEGALKVLESAMELPGVKENKKKGAKSSASKFGIQSAPKMPVTLTDRVSVFIQLAEVHSKLGNIPEATKIVQDALSKFRGTTEEVRVVVANSELAIKRNDFSAAVRMLNAIKEDSVAFTRATLVKANIYLTHRNDKRRYIQCYEKLVEAGGNKSSSSFIHLGEAYMRIQEPEKAIEAFEKALQLNPEDHGLAKKIGVALVTTHDYLKAIDYYETALQTAPDSSELHYSLAELYFKLQEYARAIRVLARSLEASSAAAAEVDKKGNNKNGGQDPALLKGDVKLLMLLADVHSGAENMERVPETLMKARSLQTTLVDSLHGESAESVRVQQTIMADVCVKLALHYEKCRNDEKAMQYYTEALRADDAHERAMLLLAKMHLRRGELEACQVI